MSDSDDELERRAIPAEPERSAPNRKGASNLFAGADLFEVVIYGGAAAAVLTYILWLILWPVWQGGSMATRSMMLGLFASAVAIVLNDIYSRRWSLLSRLLASAFGLVVVLILIVEVVLSF
mgnify:CR=1 FL=1